MTAAQDRIRRTLDESWRDESICQYEDPLLFELADGERWESGRFNAAARICLECPVEAECDDFATRMNERHGFWGGKDRGEEDRAKRLAKEALQKQS